MENDRKPIGGSIFIVWLVLLAAGLFWATTAMAQEPWNDVTASQEAAGCGLLAYEWDGDVTRQEKGFPRHKPPTANDKWTRPINYAEGTLHFRVEIRDQPQPQQMKLQYCVWQDNNALENCANKASVYGESGTVVTWTDDVQQMWKKGGKSIDWTRQRYKDGIAIKNSGNRPVSSFNNWKWNGEDPDEWYPLNWRFTVRVVAAGSEFAGWDTCMSPTAVNLKSFGAQGPRDDAVPTLTLLSLVILGILSLAIVTIKLRPER